MPAKNSSKKFIRSLEASGFYSDFDKPESLYAALIRCPAQSGKIKNITVSDLPEEYFFYTADDIPGSKTMSFNNTTSKIFGYKDISYEGEPIGIIIGPDEQVVTSLLNNVNISFDVQNLESALKNVINKPKESAENFNEFVDQLNNMPSLDTVIDKSHVQENPNVTVYERTFKYGLYKKLSEEEADKELFENSFFTSEDSWKEELYAPKWQGTEGAFCYTEGNNLHIYIPTKWTYFTQNTIAQTLNIKPENIFIHKTKISNIYPNGLWRTAQIAAQVALAAYISKKPVKLILTQQEQEKYMQPGVKTEIKYKSAINEEGLLTALKIDIDIDIGSSNPFANEISDRISLASINYYKPQNLFIKTVTHTSKNPPTTISPRVIDSQAFFAIESQIQKISYKTNIFPDEIRLINSNGAAFPIQLPDFQVADVISKVIKDSDFNRKYASFHMEAVHRLDANNEAFFALPLRGIGIATGYSSSDFAGSKAFTNNTKIEVTLNADEKLVIHSIKPSEVIQDIWKTTASEILQIPKTNIQIDSNFNIDELPETPEESISSIGIMNEVIKKCCNDIQKKRFHQPLPITSKKSTLPPSSKKWNNDDFSGTPFYSSAFISTVVEIELDTYTYGEKIKGIWICVDCGEVFDEPAATRTLKMEIQQELSTLVKGKTVICDSIHIAFVQTANKSSQIGGLIHKTLPAAFASALSLALTTQLTQLPCTEKQLFELIKNRTKPNVTESETEDNQPETEQTEGDSK